MPPRPRSWRDVPAADPNRGARLNGRGLGSWRAVVPVRGSSSRGSGRGDGRGQPNDLERTVAERALAKKDEFNPLNAGGKLLMGALDLIDTPRAAVVSGLKEFEDLTAGTPGDDASFGDFLSQTRRNMTGGEFLYGPEGEEDAFGIDVPVLGKIGAGFALDVAADPLTYFAPFAKVGTEAGMPAARKLLSKQSKDFLGEAAAKAAERSGKTFADDAARRAFVESEGAVAASQAAQKAVQFRANQALSDLEREAIGAIPGTYMNVPMRLDKIVDRIAPSRVMQGRTGPVFRVTSRELGLGKAAGHLRAGLTQNAFGNGMAKLFVKYPEYRRQMLFGKPEDAAKAILAVGERNAGDLQARLFEQVWGERWTRLAKRARAAGIDGTDLRYAVAEQVGGDTAGPSLSRVLAQAAAKGDEELVTDLKTLFPDLRDAANSIDPDLPWLMQREDYTTRLPSDEMIALRGGWGNAGGAMRKESFDFKRNYGLEEDQTDTLFGVKLRPQAEAGGKSVDQQIDEIVKAHGQPNWFETNAYKSFPEYIRRLARRYGDEYTAKRLRDLGLADAGYVKQLTEKGYTQAKAKAFISHMTIRASARGDKAMRKARSAREAADMAGRGVDVAQGQVDDAAASLAGVDEAIRKVQAQIDTTDSAAVREYEAFLREEAGTLQLRRDALMDQIDLADEQKFLLDHAHVELAHKVNMETYRATERVTRLEAKLGRLRDELEGVYDDLYRLDEGGTAGDVVREMADNEARVVQITAEMRRIEDLLQEFEDLAAMPTDQLEQQLVRVEEQLARAVQEHDLAVRSGDPSVNAANKVNALSDVKASILHEKGVIERARGRVAEIDRSNPELLIAEMDDLRNAEDMGDKLVHTLFPDLPDEVHGSRVREYMTDRMGELQAQIDETEGQVISAFADRDTMSVELAQIRADRRQAGRNLRKITKDVTAEDRVIWTQQEELLRQADEAMQRALELDWEEAQLRESMGELGFERVADEYSVRKAEGYLAVAHARNLRYEARAIEAEAKAANARKVAQTWKKIGEANFGKPLEEALVSALNAQYKALGAVSMTRDAWLVDGLRAATVMRGPEGIRGALRTYDKALNVWKAYALANPGTVLRNLMGGVFNNYLAGGVQASDYAKYMAWAMGNGKGLSAADRALFKQVDDAGLLVSSGTTLEIERRIGGVNARPWTSDFAPLRFMRDRQQNVENYVRGTLAYRTLKDGGTIEDAIDRVYKYHFNYDDLSAFERSVMRRVVPFYTWTRKNFPLMLEQIVQKPEKFARFYQLKNEIELHSPEEQIVPSYFSENLAIRMPFSFGGGGQGYVLPDLPFTALNDVTDASILFSQVTPFVKTPIEYAFGEQFFKGIPLKDEYQEVPRWLDNVPGIMPALQAAGRARRGADGQWMMKHKDMYVMEQMLPSYGKARRLFPTDERYSDRLTSSWLSFAFGLGFRTNTPQDRRNEAVRRVGRQMEWIETQKELGYLVPGEDKLPRFGQTVNAAYEQLGVEREP